MSSPGSSGVGVVVPIDDITDAFTTRLVAHGDDRGTFVETYRKEWFSELPEMLQTNRSDKKAGAVVGLHYHLKQSDYWYVISGTARVVLYDLRIGSPSQGHGWTRDISGKDHTGVYVPPGIGHGFSALTDVTLLYQVDAYYDPDDELGISWNDPEIAIDWGVEVPVVSQRDLLCPKLSDLAKSALPVY
ncbi:MAG TPA: dTDP-4-dehydrorhamnose 3,5-epimerase [Acidimicrobiales bacterium]|nr:dTDP-4-dehydrorhamnose 3,5-epimerase [Acidimicrobiales bacterium]